MNSESGYARVKAFRHAASARLLAAFGSRCGKCGYMACTQALHLHHIDPATKRFSLRGRIRRWDSLVDEARKCVCLCSNCHHELHSGLWADTSSLPRFNESFAQATVQLQRRLPASKRPRVDWARINLKELVCKASINYSAIGRLIGVSGTAVRKRASKLGYLKGV